MYDVVRSVLASCLAPTKEMIRNLIRIETGYINTNHPDFIGGSRAISACKLLQYRRWPFLIGPLAVSKFLKYFMISCDICENDDLVVSA